MDFHRIVSAAFSGTRFRSVDTGGEMPRLEGGRLLIPPALLQAAAREAIRDFSFYFRESHLRLMAEAGASPEASENDRLVIRTLLQNAVVSARGEFALCQDTGTAIVYGWKDEGAVTGADDGALLSAGIAEGYKQNYLRASQVASTSFFGEFNTRDNLPAQIHIAAAGNTGDAPAYRFLFVAKGAGSSNKTSYFPMTKALLEKDRFEAFLNEKIRLLGTAACPPYRLAVVVGGLSPELNLEVLKLATTEILDSAPYFAEGEDEALSRSMGWLRRDRYWEDRVSAIARESGLGAQFGGRALALDARVLRMPRHAGACPVSIGVSCSAHRNILAVIDESGLRIESMETNPGKFLEMITPRDKPVSLETGTGTQSIPAVDLNRPIPEILSDLTRFKPGDKVLLSGKLLVARDAAHLKWHELLAEGKELPGYLMRHPIYYAGPAETPPDRPIGSLGPTTAQRMDIYAEEFMSRGASLITLAKGNRTKDWTEACRRYGGFYLGTIGGAAAILAEENVSASEVIDYPELGMEAVRLIEVRDLLAFVITDDKGSDLYADMVRGS
ncbi:FumA C-terminus/TtdB family hydratase beta subunit [Breznakiella homolactica]|uniref:Fumarate hydratase C-terminal domain-containing protein n=1 Tax=Breznakiella homolactica TaxID=2798577 RepID=A0A7T8B9W6_9SPIR|nr:FumA C-terminus/TtdB family hydratase beta subunit [Breznakiella homolactica]QQO08360.1 FumA C-terminus/TtdB family hydratase beta subunit [Breznakiella homolactica]